jgi:predicted Zn-dependent peptidase
MVPNYRNDERRAIREAMFEMLQEEKFQQTAKAVAAEIGKFVKKNSSEFKDEESLKSAKKLTKLAVDASDAASIVNLIADLSNLLTDSATFSKQLEKIMNMI